MTSFRLLVTLPEIKTSLIIIIYFLIFSYRGSNHLKLSKSTSYLTLITFTSSGVPFSLIHTLHFLVQFNCIIFFFLENLKLSCYVIALVFWGVFFCSRCSFNYTSVLFSFFVSQQLILNFPVCKPDNKSHLIPDIFPWKWIAVYTVTVVNKDVLYWRKTKQKTLDDLLLQRVHFCWCVIYSNCSSCRHCVCPMFFVSWLVVQVHPHIFPEALLYLL